MHSRFVRSEIETRRAAIQPHRARSVRGVALLTLLLAAFGGSVREAAAALIFVTTTEQKVDADEPGCSLQEAIYSANLDESKAVTYTQASIELIDTDCVAGSGADTIVLPAGALFQMSRLVDDALNPFGPAATPIVTTAITLEAHGAVLERSAVAAFRAFAVDSGGHLTLRNIHVRGFLAKGGIGAGGGGGGLGAGGAVYVYAGTLVIEASTFQGNGAVGGSGTLGAGGGGGGVGGNGFTLSSFCQAGVGGGGARGNGEAICSISGLDHLGGGGGGTLRDGSSGSGGFNCGGDGGFGNEDGQDATCRGGGGGGGGFAFLTGSGNGGDGGYGGGGGGGADGGGDGGDGGFGGGGGAGWADNTFGADGGSGGFGGGGGASGEGLLNNGSPGNSLMLGGEGSVVAGGGGAALGGAIFSHGGNVLVKNSTFTGNFVTRGWGGGVLQEEEGAAENGSGAGGALFSVNGHLTVLFSTVSGNEATGFGGGVVAIETPVVATVLGPTFTLQNTVIANNGPDECSMSGAIVAQGLGSLGNLIEENDGCEGVVSSDDPFLGALLDNQGPTPTMAIGSSSPARNAADDSVTLPVDQRGQERPASVADIGAFELCLNGSPPLQQPCLIVRDISPGSLVALDVRVSPPGGGTTTPPPVINEVPVNSVVVLTAMPSSGYEFVSWSGPVTHPNSPTTTIVMSQPRIVTANFDTIDDDGDGLDDDVDSAPLDPDADEDGLEDGEDVEFVQEAILSLPPGAFRSSGNRNALLKQLDAIERHLLEADVAGALNALATLRKHIDGCGAVAGNDDWIVDCTAQLEIRALVDLLIDNLGP